MKKLIAIFALAGGMLTFGTFVLHAQTEGETMEDTSTQMTEDTTDDAEMGAGTSPEQGDEETAASGGEEEKGVQNVLKQKFIEGNPIWMTPVLIALIIGLALSIERIITLNLSTTNTRRLLTRVNESLKKGDVDEAKELCKATRGPVASIFYQGLDRLDEGVEAVEKSIVSYGSVQMGLLEKGLVWISLFIALAPMLGFMGTVIGMIRAFDDIAAAGDINPTIVADGIKVALLTTAFGLIVGIILQIFYNYIVSKIDSIVNNMEDASISFIDILIRNKVFDKYSNN